MLVEQQNVSVTVEHCQFLLGTPAGQLELLRMKIPADAVISVGARGILFFELYADYEAQVQIEIHDSDPGAPLDGEFTHAGEIEIDDEPISLSSLMGESAWERRLAPGSWHFTVAVTGREAAGRVHSEMMGGVEWDDVAAELAAVEQWTLRSCSTASL